MDKNEQQYYYVLLDRNRVKVPSIITKTEMVRLAGITEEMEQDAVNGQSVGTGWELYEQPYSTDPDILIGKDEIIHLESNNRRFFTACTNVNNF